MTEISEVIISEPPRRFRVTLHKLAWGGWQALIAVEEPFLPDTRWGSLVKDQHGHIIKCELNENCPISDGLFREASKIFRAH